MKIRRILLQKTPVTWHRGFYFWNDRGSKRFLEVVPLVFGGNTSNNLPLRHPSKYLLLLRHFHRVLPTLPILLPHPIHLL